MKTPFRRLYLSNTVTGKPSVSVLAQGECEAVLKLTKVGVFPPEVFAEVGKDDDLQDEFELIELLLPFLLEEVRVGAGVCFAVPSTDVV